ncbi:peroxiredoxin family protein [Gracilimonas sp.]|uniref:peroxiredoxin family protein n=1 Tax=Gracilimonas sp. TaxID=1974203 RepID=UPI0028720652|nr:thioredoxin-like domain-containing protein [Gracilimonas sp.]
MRNIAIIAVLMSLTLIAACSDKPETMNTMVKGTITVADSVDDSGDFSNIEVTIIKQDSVNAAIDTVFNSLTDINGSFSGTANFPRKNFYPMLISRNDNDIASLRVILAENDTLTVNAELPEIRETISLESREHNAMEVFRRVDRSFQRVGAFINSGTLPDSQVVDEISKWTDLYWEVYQKHENTIASYMAAEKAAELVGVLDKTEMMAKIDEALPADYMVSVALNLGKPYVAEQEGFDAASAYLDSLSEISQSESAKEIVMRDKIRMYFDSSRVKDAKQLLSTYENEFSSPSSERWAKTIRYDLNYLAPGVEAPDFTFVTIEGDTVSKKSLDGSTYILEISPLANYEYQDDYDRTLVIHEIYKNYGLKIFTIPLDQSEVTVNAFFEERRKAWPVAQLGSFDVQEIIKKFNVVQVPTRLLIDKNGELIRKYERDEFDEVIQGLNRALRNSNSPS